MKSGISNKKLLFHLGHSCLIFSTYAIARCLFPRNQTQEPELNKGFS
jgi:hypothetical protein